MAEVTTTLKDVESKEITARGELVKVYTIVADRKYTTFKRPLAEQAAPLKGQLVTIEYDERQKGEYTNYYLNGIQKASSEATTATEAASQGTLEAQSASNGSNVRSAPTDSEKNASIARAVAFKGAVELAAAGVITIESPASVLDVAEAFTPWLLGESLTKFEGFADLAIESSEVESQLAKAGL